MHDLYRFVIIQKTPGLFAAYRFVNILRKRISKSEPCILRILTGKRHPQIKSMNMDIWIVVTSNQFFIRGP